MNPAIDENDFLKEVSNIEFNLHYKDDIQKGGKIISVLIEDEKAGITLYDIKKDLSGDNWDFEVEISGCSNYEDYSEHLSRLFEKFKDFHEVRNLKKWSRGDCYDIFVREKDILLNLKGKFLQITVNDENEDYPYQIADFDFYNVNPSDSNKYDEGDFKVQLKIAPFLSVKLEFISSALGLLNLKLEWLKYALDEKFGNDSNAPIKSSMKSSLVWTKSDTSLLELVTALMEIKAINNSDHNLTRKDAIDIFSKLFGLEIKDVESKLSKATDRKMGVSPFLAALKESFDNYANKKLQK